MTWSQTPIPFPYAGFARHRIKPLQRLRAAVSKLRTIATPDKKTASKKQLQALQKRFAKG